MKNEKPIKKNKNFVTRVIANEVILMPIYKNSDEINCIYTLNEDAARIWDLIDGKKTYSQVKEKLINEYDVTAQEIEKQMKALFKDLQEIKAIELGGSNG